MVTSHHTKDTGDIGVAHAFADLTDQGYAVLLPATEHAAFDLVAYKDEHFSRVQVKYRSATNGRVDVAFKSTWTDRHGLHRRPLNKAEVDVICIFCPDSGWCYYVSPHEVGGSVTLRLGPSRNNQRRNVRWAVDYRSMARACSLPSDGRLNPEGAEQARTYAWPPAVTVAQPG